MRRDELEYSISQYIDGNLGAAERDVLEARLEQDADARALLAEYRSIDVALHSLPLPPVRWDAFARRVSAAVDQLDEPAQSYRIGSFRLTRWVAAAAAVIVAAGVAFQMSRPAPTPVVTNVEPPAAAPIVIKIVNEALPGTPADPAAPVVVAIGPSNETEKWSPMRRYAGDIVSRPSQVIIASSVRPAQDIGGGGSPF